MRNISLLSIDVGRLSPLWMTVFPRQGVLSSVRGGSQLRASKDPCVFLSLLGAWMFPSALSSCLDFPAITDLKLEWRANEILFSWAAFCQGIYHSNRNEAKTGRYPHRVSDPSHTTMPLNVIASANPLS